MTCEWGTAIKHPSISSEPCVRPAIAGLVVLADDTDPGFEPVVIALCADHEAVLAEQVGDNLSPRVPLS